MDKGLSNARRLLTGVALSALTAAPAFAQGQSETTGLEEIVVTAQKREQSVQDVPIAVTALTADTLQANRVTTVNDLSGLAPGVTVRESAGGVGVPTFTVRGAVSYGVVPGSDKQVSIYLDGVYISSPRGSIFDLPDVTRIEMLRGPQGTLFGRNATAGAVSVTTRDPSGEAHVKATASVGNLDHGGFRLSADTPQIGPFSGYFSFSRNYTRGEVRNLGAGALWNRGLSPTGIDVVKSPKWLGTADRNSYFGALKFQPVDALKVVYKYDHSTDEGTPDAQVFLGFDPNRPLLGNLIGALVNNQPGGAFQAYPNARRPKTANNSFASNKLQHVTGHSVTTDWEASDTITVKNIFGYRRSKVFTAAPIDGVSGLTFVPQALVPYATFVAFSRNPGLATAPAAVQAATIGATATALAPLVGQPFVLLASSSYGTSKQWSDELQVNYNSELLDITAGGLWFKGRDQSGGLERLANTAQFAPIPGGVLPIANQGISRNRATSIAAYVQAELHVNDQITAVGGARVTKDKKSGDFIFGTFPALTTRSFTYRKTKPNYMLGVNYQPNTDILAYAKYSTAFVSGGSVAGLEFKPETVTSWEGGVKADMLDRRLRTNLAIFHARYKNFQTAQSGTNFIGVLPGAADIPVLVYPQGGPVTAKGFELEVTARPVRGFTVGGSAGYTKTSFKDVDPILIAANQGSYVPTLRPKWSGTLWGQYESEPLFGDATFSIRADGNWRTSMRLDANPNRNVAAFAGVADVPGTWIINGRAALRHLAIGGVDGELALWGRNLTNDKKPVFALTNSGIEGQATFQKARTYGVDLTIEF